jgi:hypothetical protein
LLFAKAGSWGFMLKRLISVIFNQNTNAVVFPILQYDDGVAIVGGYVYRGSQIPKP